MDQKDRAILDIIQSEFPICERPYHELGKIVELTEAEVLAG